LLIGPDRGDCKYEPEEEKKAKVLNQTSFGTANSPFHDSIWVAPCFFAPKELRIMEYLDDSQGDCSISIFTCALRSDRKQGKDLVLFASTGKCG